MSLLKCRTIVTMQMALERWVVRSYEEKVSLFVGHIMMRRRGLLGSGW
jgi:hypothetical protein